MAFDHEYQHAGQVEPLPEVVDPFSIKAADRMGDMMSELPHLWSTPFDDLNRHFGYWGCGKGIPRGEYMVLAGGSYTGKTTTAIIAMEWAASSGEAAAITSYESRRDDLLLKFQIPASESAIPWKYWRPDRWKPVEHGSALLKAVTQHRSKHLKAHVGVVGGLAGMPLGGLLELLHAMKEDGYRFIVVDHLGLIRAEGVRDRIENYEIVSEALRVFAHSSPTRAEGVTICALSQLKRTAAEDYTRSPVLQDCLGGTAIESNADHVWILDHSRHRRLVTAPHMARGWLMIPKNRLGAGRLEIPVEWDYHRMTMRQADPDEIDDGLWPDHGNDDDD